MDKIEYNFNKNKIGLSIKRPTGLNKKWSEAYENLQCDTCGGSHIESFTNGAVFCIVCLDCPEYDFGSIEEVCTYHSSEEAILNEPVGFRFSE
jgi:hypothetical protein